MSNKLLTYLRHDQ